MHSKLSPSSAARWSACSASVKFIEDNLAILPAEDTTYSAEGTRAHACAAAQLLNQLGQVADNPEMQGHVDGYVKWLKQQKFDGARVMIERQVPLFYLPDQHGTVDCAIVSDHRIFIADLKYGAGVSVEAEGNKQLAIYAESIIEELEPVDDIPDSTPVVIGIYQPRDRNNPEPVRTWNLNRGHLREFCADIAIAALAISQGAYEFSADPEKQCRFCRAKGICKEYATFGLQAITDVPDPLDPQKLTREQRIRILTSKKALITWLEAIEDQEVADLMNGAPIQGFKLVEGKTNRKWVDPDAVAKLLKNYLDTEEIYHPREVVSPAQAEKLLTGKEVSTRFSSRFQSLITKGEGKPTLVPETDKRPALVLNPIAELENLDII